MQSSKLHNLYLKVRSDENRIRYKKQRNICASLLRKAKRKQYEDLSIALLLIIRSFGKEQNLCLEIKSKGIQKLR